MAHEVKLGQLIDEHQQRDAIHIAIAPVVAAERLYQGQEIGFAENSTTRVVSNITNPIGIVDPFLKQSVYPEQRFWMFLFPQTITSLRHDWTHPAFGQQEPPVPDAKALATAFVTQFAAEVGQTYEGLMDAAELLADHEEYTYDNCERYKRADWDKWPEFWRHFAVLTGKAVEDCDRCPFTCSC